MMSPEMAAGEPPVDYAHFLDTTGLGPETLDAEVSFGNWTGTVGAMLADERCPVGAMVKQAYEERGITGVEQTLTGFRMADSRFDVTIDETTRGYHNGDIDRDGILQTRTETSDFLA